MEIRIREGLAQALLKQSIKSADAMVAALFLTGKKDLSLDKGRGVVLQYNRIGFQKRFDGTRGLL